MLPKAVLNTLSQGVSHAFCFHEPAPHILGVILDVLALSPLVSPVLQVRLFDVHVLDEAEGQADGVARLESQSQQAVGEESRRPSSLLTPSRRCGCWSPELRSVPDGVLGCTPV